jgi:hypothetical protein
MLCVLIITTAANISLYSQNKNISLRDISGVNKNVVFENDLSLYKTSIIGKLSQLKSSVSNQKNDSYKTIPIPPADTSNSKFELLPLSKPGQLSFRYLK